MPKITVSTEQIAQEILRQLHQYTSHIVMKMDEAGETATKEGVALLKAISPKRTGEYKKGWTVKRVTTAGRPTTFVVHNKTHYRLTHLLEKGHATRDGKRTEPYTHIATAEEEMVGHYEALVRRAIQGE